jgi:hypothetical protein
VQKKHEQKKQLEQLVQLEQLLQPPHPQLQLEQPEQLEQLKQLLQLVQNPIKFACPLAVADVGVAECEVSTWRSKSDSTAVEKAAFSKGIGTAWRVKEATRTNGKAPVTSRA